MSMVDFVCLPGGGGGRGVEKGRGSGYKNVKFLIFLSSCENWITRIKKILM